MAVDFLCRKTSVSVLWRRADPTTAGCSNGIENSEGIRSQRLRKVKQPIVVRIWSLASHYCWNFSIVFPYKRQVWETVVAIEIIFFRQSMNLLGIFEVFTASWPIRVCRPPHNQQNLNPWCSTYYLMQSQYFFNMEGLKSQFLQWISH